MRRFSFSRALSFGRALSFSRNVCRLIGADARVFDNDVVCRTFSDRRLAYERDLRFLLQFGNREGAAVAHRVDDFARRRLHVVVEASGVRNVAVDAFFEGHLFRPAQIVALPVARSVRSFTPIFSLDRKSVV